VWVWVAVPAGTTAGGCISAGCIDPIEQQRRGTFSIESVSNKRALQKQSGFHALAVRVRAFTLKAGVTS
jgi:hypothetical protein